LSFYFPLKSASPESLGRLFEEEGRSLCSKAFPKRIGRLDFSPVKGFMRGFMDMVFQCQGRFYLVDWKSNFLGPRLEDYGPEGMVRAMEEGFYILQCTIYTLALNQYLKLRLPGYEYERDFGGVYYIFLRGVEPSRGAEFGVYRDRPSRRLIDALTGALIG
ncbi:MAG: exodeoxyribonuclease V subunit beta, partial [Pseudomonadota bacterium]